MQPRLSLKKAFKLLRVRSQPPPPSPKRSRATKLGHLELTAWDRPNTLAQQTNLKATPRLLPLNRWWSGSEFVDRLNRPEHLYRLPRNWIGGTCTRNQDQIMYLQAIG